MKKDNLVFLNFRPTEAVEEGVTFLACKVCRNKTYTIIYDKNDDFPIVKCAACRSSMGRAGWADED